GGAGGPRRARARRAVARPRGDPGAADRAGRGRRPPRGGRLRERRRDALPGRHVAPHGRRAPLGEHRPGRRRGRVARRRPLAGHRDHRGGGLAPDRLAAAGPDRVASQPAFRFPPSSPWVIAGRDLGVVRGGVPLVFDEVHRLTAPAGGVLRARTLDGARLADIEWTLAPGQTVTLRAGDEISRGSTLRLRFEADKRVPGAPASGMVWADGRPRRWLERVGLAVTLLVGAAALLRAGLVVRLSRERAGVAAGGLLLAFVWAQAWAVYAMIQAPDLFLGGITLERLLELPAHVLFAEPWR